MNEPKVSISERLKELLNFYGIKQTDVVEKTGIAKSALSNYISGYRIPRQDKIGAISEAYNIDPAWLMGFDVPMKKKTPTVQAQEDFELLERWHRLNESQKLAVNKTIDAFLGVD